MLGGMILTTREPTTKFRLKMHGLLARKQHMHRPGYSESAEEKRSHHVAGE